MDTTTLVVANGILFVLYACVMLVNARIVGGARGAMWFAGSNLLRGIAMLVVGVQWTQLSSIRYAAASGAVLSVIGTLMLHQAFAELLERGVMMRSVQYTLVAIMIVGSVLMMMRPQLEVYLGVALCGVLCIQFAVVAMLVFRFSGEGVGPVGWLTGTALAIYSATFLVRAYAASTLGVSLLKLVPWIMTTWLLSCLVTTAATAFGFMSLSTARLRVELLWRAQVDELTGLLNRWALKRLVMREIARSSRTRDPIAIIMIDLDGLKIINDTQGHACGDVVLQACAGLLQETVREQDAVARMGGDEFCVLLPSTNLDDARVIAERLRLEIDELAVNYRGETVSSAASLGVASSDLCGLSWQALMDASDGALYRAKRDGKNRVIVANLDDVVSFVPRANRSPIIREQGNLVN